MALELGRDKLYALVFKNSDDIPPEEYTRKFNEYGNVVDTRNVNNLVFIRYQNRLEAEACITGLADNPTYRVRPARNKGRTSDQFSDTNSISGRSLSACNLKKINGNSSEFGSNDNVSYHKSFTPRKESKKYVLGQRCDGNTHLFLANLSPNTKREHIQQLLQEFEVFKISKIFKFLPEQLLTGYYVMVTMPVASALAAMLQLKGKVLLGNQIQPLEVQVMYEEVINPLSKGNSHNTPPTLEEIARKKLNNS